MGYNNIHTYKFKKFRLKKNFLGYIQSEELPHTRQRAQSINIHQVRNNICKNFTFFIVFWLNCCF